MTRRIFYDTEFLEDGSTIELISIGMVDNEGNEFYAVNSEMPTREVSNHKWLCNNVVPHLPLSHTYVPTVALPTPFYLDQRHPSVKPKWVIRNEVLEFLDPTDDWRDLELWAYYGAYDHVALAQLWGRMLDLPEGVPMFTNDLMTLWNLAGRPEKPSQSETEHHALADARWNSKLFDVCWYAGKVNGVVDKTSQLWAGMHSPDNTTAVNVAIELATNCFACGKPGHTVAHCPTKGLADFDD